MANKETHPEQQSTVGKGAQILGGCLCGAIRFRVKIAASAVMCHCKQCQKAQGAAFACNFPVLESDFEYLSGAEEVIHFRSSNSKVRVFCSSCGSPIFSKKDTTNTLRIRSGTLDNLNEIAVVAHIFARSAAKWAPILDNLPQHDGFEPDRS